MARKKKKDKKCRSCTGRKRWKQTAYDIDRNCDRIDLAWNIWCIDQNGCRKFRK